MYGANDQASCKSVSAMLAQGWKDGLQTVALTADDREAVLKFLAERPIHTVAMAGFIRDNGIISDLNRGAFYGCRDMSGRLEAVALIGHAILMDARTDRAVRALAELAKENIRTHMIMAEEERATSFLKYYGDGAQLLSRASRQVLLELRWPMQDQPVDGLRLGTLNDIDLVVPVHAQMSFDESGVDPLATDGSGFIARCARRLQLGRTFVLVEDGKLLFKADVIAETPEAAYLEGVWAIPEISGSGCARNCLTQLATILLTRTKTICLLSNIENERALAFYAKAGFTPRAVYDSIFLKRDIPTVRSMN